MIPIPSYHEIVALLKKGATLEAQEKIMELREAVLQLQEENHTLRGEMKTLKESLTLKEALSFDGSVYWTGKDHADGPFCQPCYDTKQQLVRLHSSKDWADKPSWWCHACNINYKKM